MLVRRLDIFHSLLVEAVHLCEQGIGHGVTPPLHEPRLVAAPGLHLLPLAISARVDLEYLGPASQQPLVVMHHVLDVLPVQPGLLLIQAPDLQPAAPCSHASCPGCAPSPTWAAPHTSSQS